MVHTTIDHGPSSQPHSLLERLAENWWLLLIRGIVAVAFGIAALVWPGKALLVAVFLYGAYAFSDGLLALIAAFSRRSSGASTWWLVLMGIFGMLAGVIAFVWPGITALILVLVFASWAVLMGVLEIAGAIELRKEIDNEWWLILGGVVSIVFGLLVLANPGMGAVALVWLMSFYALILGSSWIALAFRLRKHANRAPA
jgi:uncharacterized membrane protein HdeD (DUF308 family)